ncbi:MAG: AAA family ATPase [Candidatus Omnitrophica bacterium]|nr:AAA family ATPase [Candidatus Omnitrophota bacterium]MBU0879153.1 AAA family ATPase [Candidatus Omnitrophota bacterium]MBU0896674.1 AAA family ATPase [Candidatus Omnitrophota bacterium]MBU1134029.1 AAA family ATPase [Candidatus Omnitrophota bacterium]MBU1810025.1 AAA family ATPase [Candidatus Omnitrophota bacterium]
MGDVIGICNQKGGIGKTTTAINVSSYLGLSNRKTLLVDMDPQGNATSGVGFNSEGKHSTYEVIMGNVSIKDSVYPTSWPQLYILPSHIALTGGEIELVDIKNRELRLKEEIDKIKEEFAYIIVDAPPSLGLFTVNVLTASDKLIIPIQSEYYALEGVSNLLHTIELIKERLNPFLDIEGVLLTMVDFRTRLALQVIEEVRRFFKEKTFNTIIPRNVKLAEAPSFGKPIHFYEPACIGAKAYLNLTQEILKEKIEIDNIYNQELSQEPILEVQQ